MDKNEQEILKQILNQLMSLRSYRGLKCSYFKTEMIRELNMQIKNDIRDILADKMRDMSIDKKGEK